MKDLVLKDAIVKLDMCLERNEMKYFISGILGYGLGYRRKDHKRSLSGMYGLMESIYLKYKTFPDIKEIFYNSMLELSTKSINPTTIIDLLGMLEYHDEKLKAGTATFDFDRVSILEAIKKNLIVNKSYFERSDNVSFMPEINEHIQKNEILLKL